MPATEILLVEDDRDVREALAEVLEQEGYLVLVARNGQDAVQHLKRARQMPAAILLDLMMPVMDGWEFWSIQRSTADWCEIPVVIVSADADAAERAHTRRALACLRKPIDIDELLGILETVTSNDQGGGGGDSRRESLTPALPDAK
ncbi:MAG: response regulator [Myxococcales bacterium]